MLKQASTDLDKAVEIISPQRAIAMAKNIFVHGDFKRLREIMHRYKKDEQLRSEIPRL